MRRGPLSRPHISHLPVLSTSWASHRCPSAFHLQQKFPEVFAIICSQYTHSQLRQQIGQASISHGGDPANLSIDAPPSHISHFEVRPALKRVAFLGAYYHSSLAVLEMTMSQPDDDPRIQAFLTWVDKTCVAGLADPASKVRPKFLPLKSLKEHFEANQYRNLKGLLHAVFQPGELPVDADEVAEKCPIVFCTLLLIGRAKYIRTIVQHDHLQDAHLPFHPENPPKDFPNDTSDQDPTALLTRFCEKQWMLCVPAIDYQVHRNFEANRILPIMFLDKLSGGGSAILYKVVLYQNYNKLHTSDDISPVQANPFANTFVLKTYFGRDAERYYTNEVSAFKRLRTRTTSMIGFFGSFKQGDRYNVLLEYADKGPLEKYFKTIPPPTSGEDIIRFWSAMFGLIEALLRIHEGETPLSSDSSVQPLQGWHQDVKPSNILVSSKSETIASPYDWRFKLADLGISHFKSQVSSLEDNVDHDSQGTGTYGAPECCRTDEVLMKSKLKVKQNVDVWSLGAVFSEAAVWLVEGYQGLKEYRNNRRSATKNSPGIRGSDCFHDGEKMLDTVHQRHKRLADGFRKNDVITESVLGMVEYMMLDEHSRLPTRTCWAKSQNILHEAERELKAKRSGNEISTPTKRKPPPSVVSSKSSATSLKEPVQEYKDTGDQGPGVLQPSLVDSPGGLATGETEVQFNSTEDHRNGFKQIPSHYQQQRLPTKSGSASGSEFANPNFYPPMSLRSQTFGSHRGTHQVTQSVPVNNNGFKFYSEDNEDDERKEFLPNHRSQASERHKVVSMPLGLTRQPEESFQKTPQRGLSTQAGRTLQNVQATFAQDSYADTDFSRQRYSSSNHLEYMSPATYTDDNRDPVWDSSHQHQKAAGYVSPPPQQTVLRPHFNSTFQKNPRENANSHWVPSTSGQSRPPNKYQPSEYLSPPVPVTPEPSVKHEPPAILQVGTASAWLARKGKISELEGYFLFDRLKARDHVFIIDDALSMSKHWQELLPLFKVLAYMVKSADPDGIDLHFTMSDEKFNSKEYRWSINSSTKLVNIVNHRRLKGSSNITYRLESILAPYEAKLTDSHNLRRGGAVRPLNIYIMTDGIWESQCDAQSAIKSIVSKLIKLEYPKDSKQIGIQFIRFGNDPTGVKRLKDLDDNLGQDMDIVDTTPSNGNVWKMLLGAIDKTFDEAYEGPSTAAN